MSPHASHELKTPWRLFSLLSDSILQDRRIDAATVRVLSATICAGDPDRLYAHQGKSVRLTGSQRHSRAGERRGSPRLSEVVGCGWVADEKRVELIYLVERDKRCGRRGRP